MQINGRVRTVCVALGFFETLRWRERGREGGAVGGGLRMMRCDAVPSGFFLEGRAGQCGRVGGPETLISPWMDCWRVVEWMVGLIGPGCLGAGEIFRGEGGVLKR